MGLGIIAPRLRRATVLRAAATLAALGAGTAQAGGLSLYEVGTEDVGLASAGYSARAQDASTVLTNPAGMTRLPGTQVTLGAQLLYGDLGFSIAQGTSPALGSGNGGNPVGWFPGGGGFVTYAVNPNVVVGFGLAGNFGLSLKYDDNWAGRYYARQSTLIGLSLLPSVAYKVTDKLSLGLSLNVMYGYLKNTVAVNNLVGGDGELELSNGTWGVGANVGVLYEFTPGTRVGLTYNSPVDLNFSANANFSGLSPGVETLLRSRGLLNANIDLGVRVPQGLMLSGFHRLDNRWALLGSLGWQQWSQFGKVQVGVESNDPRSLTTNLDYKNTWHVALGTQYQLSEPWRLNFGVAYDSGFQSGDVPPALPANWAWRFGAGAQNQVSKSFGWGVSGEYLYGGTLNVNEQSAAPVVLGGRGNLVGSYPNSGIFFLAANFNWKF